jgi:hypothetical protein
MWPVHPLSTPQRTLSAVACHKAGIEIDDITATGALLEQRLPIPRPPS